MPRSPVEDERGRADDDDQARGAASGQGLIGRFRWIDHRSCRISGLLRLYRDQGSRGGGHARTRGRTRAERDPRQPSYPVTSEPRCSSRISTRTAVTRSDRREHSVGSGSTVPTNWHRPSCSSSRGCRHTSTDRHSSSTVAGLLGKAGGEAGSRARRLATNEGCRRDPGDDPWDRRLTIGVWQSLAGGDGG